MEDVSGRAVSTAYHSESVTLYHGDVLNALEKVPAKSVGLLATDPPYGVSWKSNFRSKSHKLIHGDDGSMDVVGLLANITRSVVQPRRHVYIFGFRPDQLKDQLHLGGTCELIWDKGEMGLGNLSSPWGSQHEPITFGVYTPAAKDRSSGRGNLSARLRQGSILRVNRSGGRADRHPTEKPVELMRRIIESSTSIGDVVLDPFAGSGSTLVAAVLAGRKAIGVEIEEAYVRTAIERVKAAENLARLMEAA